MLDCLSAGSTNKRASHGSFSSQPQSLVTCTEMEMPKEQFRLEGQLCLSAPQERLNIGGASSVVVARWSSAESNTINCVGSSLIMAGLEGSITLLTVPMAGGEVRHWVQHSRRGCRCCLLFSRRALVRQKWHFFVSNSGGCSVRGAWC